MSFAQELYDQLKPLSWDEENQGDALWKYCQALAAPFEPVYDLVRDLDTGEPGWARLLDPNNAPAEYLPWLRQVAGVTPIRGESNEALRQRIINAENYRRGTPSLINETAARLGATVFLMQERFTSPWTVRLLFTAAQHNATIEAAIRAIIPAGLVVTVAFWSGLLYSNLTSGYASYTALAAAFTNYNDIQL